MNESKRELERISRLAATTAIVDRRQCLAGMTAVAAIGALPTTMWADDATTASETASDKSSALPAARFSFGLVTYQWGADWDLPTLIERCAAAKLSSVELRTTHRHGVEPALDAAARKEVARHFADSAVKLIGLGSDYRFDSPDAEVLAANVEGTKAFLQLSHDVGASGVKVKPNDLPKNVPVERTIAQIGATLNELGKFAADLGQQVRLEVHGQCAKLPIIKQIVDLAEHKNVAICWNSNAEDLSGEGLAHNFALVRPRFGETLHVHELDSAEYPYAELFRLLRETNYAGHVLLEASSKPSDRAAALVEQRKLFERLATN
ncbi:MAG: TIM barrel protein [Pirellulales bacterium]